MKVIVALGILCCATSVGAWQTQNEPLDFSCAVFPEDLSEAGLISRYGAENVIRAPVVGADDGPIDGTVLFPDSDDRVEITWRDTENRRVPAWVRVREEGSRWSTPHGITVGDDLLGVERRNGWPFRLRGFEGEGWLWGALRSWGRGRLQNVDLGDCAIRINFLPNENGNADPMLFGQVTCGEFSSGHPAMQGLNPSVVAIWITYPLR